MSWVTGCRAIWAPRQAFETSKTPSGLQGLSSCILSDLFCLPRGLAARTWPGLIRLRSSARPTPSPGSVQPADNRLPSLASARDATRSEAPVEDAIAFDKARSDFFLRPMMPHLCFGKQSPALERTKHRALTAQIPWRGSARGHSFLASNVAALDDQRLIFRPVSPRFLTGHILGEVDLAEDFRNPTRRHL